MFRQILENELRKRKLSVRKAAKEIGVSHSTLIAARDGTRKIDLDTAVAITKWAGVPLSMLIVEASPETYKEDDVLQAVNMVLGAAPQLKQVFVDAADELGKGTLSLGDFQDIVEYAAYKIRTRREQVNGNEETASRTVG